MISRETIDQVVSAAMRAFDVRKDRDEAMASASAEYARTSPPSGTPPLRLMLTLRNAFRERGLSVDFRTVQDALASTATQSGPAGGDDPTATLVPTTGSRLQGQPVAFSDPEPWPDPVDGADLLQRIADFVRRFVVLPEYAANAIAAWVVATYAVAVFTVAPILLVRSPTMRCAKSLLLEILTLLVWRPYPTVQVNPANIYRVTHQLSPTVILDEAEALGGRGDRSQALREILNAGYRRGWSVPRCVGDSYEVRLFNVFGFKAVAAIGRIWRTLEDRSIIIEMRRKSREEQVERFRHRKIQDEAETIRRMAARWVKDNLEAIGQSEPELPEFLDDRGQDSWEILLQVGSVAGGDWYERLVKSSKRMRSTRPDDDDAELLLRDLRDIFRKKKKDRLTSDSIVRALKTREDRRWGDWNGPDRPITTRQLARLLAPFKVKPRTLRTGNKTLRGYRISDLQPLFAAYLPPEPQQSQHPRNDGGKLVSKKRNEQQPVADGKPRKRPRKTEHVADVADRPVARRSTKRVPASVLELTRSPHRA